MLDLILIVIFYIFPMIYFLKVAYIEEDGMFVLFAVIPALNFIVLFFIITIEGSTKLIKWIKYR